VREQDRLCDEAMGATACVPCVPRWRFQKDAEIASSVAFYQREVESEIAAARLAIAPSQSHRDLLDRFQRALGDRLRVLPHPRLTALAPAPSPRGGRLRLGAWSHIAPLKGMHVLLEALRLARCGRDVELHIFGTSFLPDYQARLDHLADGLRVTFHGAYRPEQLAEAALDLAVIPTLARESYSFILDEAAALGLPILSADGGALAERATERVRLFRRGDAADLAAQLDRLVASPGELERVRRAPPPPVLDVAAHMAQLAQLYREALARPQTPVPPIGREHLRHAFDQREAGFKELVRSEKWEDVVAEQNEIIARLTRELQQRDQGAT
jgi:glycosyltransferase involved in cell wall biosynthesis